MTLGGRHRGLAVRAAGVAALLALLLGVLAGCTSSAAPEPMAGGTPSVAASAGGAGTGGSAAYVVPACPRLPSGPGPRGDLPDLRLPCLGDGPAVNLADLRGTPTVLNVWAAWCPPCREEMPVLAEGMRQAGDRVRFFGVQYKAPPAYGLRSARDFGVPFPSVQDTDGDRTVAALRATAPPQTFFYTADGRLAGRTLGAIRSPAELARLVQRYLGVRL